jgi:hypothetical protein
MSLRFQYGPEGHSEPNEVGDAWIDTEMFGGYTCSQNYLLQQTVCSQRDGEAREPEKNEARWRDVTLTEVRSTGQGQSWRPPCEGRIATRFFHLTTHVQIVFPLRRALPGICCPGRSAIEN